jgi:hypothetical protein
MTEGRARPLYLHLGLPKTASTFLQERVFPLLDHLEVRAVPRTAMFRTPKDAAREHRLFPAALRRSPAVWEAWGEALMDDLVGPGDAGCRGLLVSDEAIGRGASRPEALAAHLEAFARVASRRGFGAPRMVAFLRRQDHWLASHYAQISDRKGGGSQAGFTAMVERTLDPAHDRYGFGMLLDFGALHAALASVSGAGRVLLLPHEALVAEPEPTLRRLLDWLGMPEPGIPPLLAAAGVRANVRGEARGGVPSWRLRPPTLALGGRRFGIPSRFWPARRIALTPELSARILAAYGESNARVAARATLDLAAYGYFTRPESNAKAR